MSPAAPMRESIGVRVGIRIDTDRYILFRYFEHHLILCTTYMAAASQQAALRCELADSARPVGAKASSSILMRDPVRYGCRPSTRGPSASERRDEPSRVGRPMPSWSAIRLVAAPLSRRSRYSPTVSSQSLFVGGAHCARELADAATEPGMVSTIDGVFSKS